MPETAAVAAYQSIPVAQIRPSTHQARKVFDEAGIKNLAESIKQEGLIQPITVRIVSVPKQENDVTPIPRNAETPTQFELVSGERRLRAAKLLGWEFIDARVIQTVSEAESAAKGLVENLQREDLNPMEEAEGLAELNKLDPDYWTQTKIAEITGKSKSHVSELIRFLGFSEKIKDEFRRRNLTADHGAELLRLPTQELQDKVADKIDKKGLTSKQTREVVAKLLTKAAKKADPANDHDAQPEPSFKFSGKAMDAWVTFSGHYPIIGNWDDFVVNLRKAYEDWRAKGIKGGKKKGVAMPSETAETLQKMKTDGAA